jgi:hypothetical protein
MPRPTGCRWSTSILPSSAWSACRPVARWALPAPWRCPERPARGPWRRSLPVAVLKLDGSFLTDVAESAEAAAVVTAVLELAAALGMAAVAEGVETEAQRAFLVARGCPLAQGFLLGRPAPAADLTELIAAASRRAACR